MTSDPCKPSTHASLLSSPDLYGATAPRVHVYRLESPPARIGQAWRVQMTQRCMDDEPWLHDNW